MESNGFIQYLGGARMKNNSLFNRTTAHNGIFRLPPIQRKNDEELDIAIADLEARGFRLVSRGSRSKDVKEFEYKQSSKTPKTYKGATTYSNVWAVMEKSNHKESGF